MTRFEFNLATQADDDQLGELLAATPMDGDIRIAFSRRPSYFGAAAVDGTMVQVGVARDTVSGRVIGMGSRSISLRYVNGEPVNVGYLGGLRLLREFRGQGRLLARGYQFLQRLHEDRRTSVYLTTIAADNAAAHALLTSGRAGLPVYHLWGSFHSLSLSTARPVNGSAYSGGAVEVRPAVVEDCTSILRFLNREGRSRQFFPVYEARDLFSGDGLLKGMGASDILLACRDGEIVGTLGCWDQRSFKQVVVHGYHGKLRPMRPLYNVWASLRHRPTLPAAGSVLPIILAAIPVVRDSDHDVFRQLLETALYRLAEQDESLLIIGLHDADPLLPIAQQYSGREYVTQLYLVYWYDEVPDFNRLMQRVPYLELGSL